MSGITVQFGTIGQAQADVSNTVGRMNGQLDELRSYLAPLVSTWEGAASSDYQTLQRRWDTAAGDLNQVLMQISQLLGKSNEGYQLAENANARAWGTA